MATSYSVLINKFFDFIEKDRDFFNYFGVDDVVAMEIAQNRAKNYLDEAVWRMTLECHPSIDLTDRDDETAEFNVDLNGNETLLLSSLMYEYYLLRDISYLKLQNVNYTSTELRVFDPSNARSSFYEMFEGVCNRNKMLIDNYNSTDRNSGSLLGVDYTTYNVDEE